MINSKFIGGLLLIIGTSIGGGMLALPVVTAAAGFGNSILLLSLCWLIMTSGALLVLEVNLRLPTGSNMVSMARETLGVPGQALAWITYLFLLYTLLAAYISGGSDVFTELLHKAHVHLPSSIIAIIYTFLFSLIIYSGIHAVDYINRGLMFGKLGVYILLLLIISPNIHGLNIHNGSITAITGSLMILITSFGFASIVPSLREYFNDDIKSLRKVIVYGSFVPLLCYLLWEAVIMGTVALDGEYGLLNLRSSEHATSGLMKALNQSVNSNWISGFFSFFSSICMVTAFLAVSLGLFDFLADGLNLKKKGKQGKLTLSLTFLPPLIIVLFYPGVYLQALNYAGGCCVVLLLLLPALMAWKSRKNAAEDQLILIPGGNLSLLTIGAVSVILLMIACFSY